jgi:hypothetical protein
LRSSGDFPNDDCLNVSRRLSHCDDYQNDAMFAIHCGFLSEILSFSILNSGCASDSLTANCDLELKKSLKSFE